MEEKYQNGLATVLVIVGITGDLAKRKLLPALIKLLNAKVLPEKFYILGITRGSMEKTDLLKDIKSSEILQDKLEILNLDLNKLEDLKTLKLKLDAFAKDFREVTQFIFNLSVPPRATLGLLEALPKVGFDKNSPHLKLLLEKPFGYDLASAKELIEKVRENFTSEQIYRIDHYLAKEMAQNILIFREKNYLFKKTWNHEFISQIEIVAEESIGIEGRANFFEQTGTLRDLVQSHLLQLTALTLLKIEPEKNVRTSRAEALKKLSLAKNPETGEALAFRGQYQNYRSEVQNPNSTVETFVNLELVSQDESWRGVPIILRTGKNLYEKKTEIKIYYRGEDKVLANQLTLKIQPEEGIAFSVNSKVGGYTKEIEKNVLSMTYETHGESYDAYEQVLVDAIYSDPDLFISDEEVLESWRIIDEVQHLWQRSGTGLVIYPLGIRGKDVLKNL